MEQPTLADIGLGATAEADLDAAQARRVARTLDLSVDDVVVEGTVPLEWVWAWFTPTAATAALRPDGHPAGPLGGALSGLDRRMFVGGTLERLGDICLGVRTLRTSLVVSAEEKHGGTGPFVVVDVEHRYEQHGSDVLVERQQLLYRTATTTPTPPTGAAVGGFDAGSAAVVTPDERLLFRFSALTFNTHRIHYDLPYATEVEGYPGLVVHGPLTAILLAGVAAAELGRALRSFSFRATAPTFAGVPLALHAEGSDPDELTLRAVRSDDVVAMTARAR